MLGNISGDIIGSVWEMNFNTPENVDLFYKRSRFTDDTVLTSAVAHVLLSYKNPTEADFAKMYAAYWNLYPHRGYGSAFIEWATNYTKEYANLESYGNGCIMRVAPIAWARESLDDVLQLAKISAVSTHDHEESEKAVRAVAGAVFLAKKGNTKNSIRTYVENCGYDLDETAQSLYAKYKASSCMAVVPLAFQSFFNGENFEGVMRHAISLGGDVDTVCAISGGIAEAHYKDIPNEILFNVKDRLDPHLIRVIKKFRRKYIVS